MCTLSRVSLCSCERVAFLVDRHLVSSPCPSVDRRMWYMLNSVGRQTSTVEVSGVFSHWLAEKRMERAVKTPMVKEAVSAYKAALEEILYVDESELWHSKEH